MGDERRKKTKKRTKKYGDDDALKLKRCKNSHRNRHNTHGHKELNDRGSHQETDAQFNIQL